MKHLKKTRDIVVVGASAGGVSALQRLVAELPADLAAAVLVVLHVGAHPSLLPELLNYRGPLSAGHARDGEPVVAGRIYVAPPDHHMLLSGRSIRLVQSPKEHHTRPAIDPLFRSAALEHGPAVIGVVLTGRLDDGTAGLEAIKAGGGIAVVQDPADAEEPGMPASAVSNVAVDHCVPLAGMAALLRTLVAQAVDAEELPPVLAGHEQAVNLGEGNAMEHLQTIGAPSPLACPDCHGTLWEISGAGPPRYRCHTGHAFSIRSLEAVHAKAAEDALWSAARTLYEKVAVQRRLAEQARLAGEAAQAQGHEAAVQELAQQAALLRQLAQGGVLSP